MDLSWGIEMASSSLLQFRAPSPTSTCPIALFQIRTSVDDRTMSFQNVQFGAESGSHLGDQVAEHSGGSRSTSATCGVRSGDGPGLGALWPAVSGARVIKPSSDMVMPATTVPWPWSCPRAGLVA